MDRIEFKYALICPSIVALMLCVFYNCNQQTRLDNQRDMEAIKAGMVQKVIKLDGCLIRTIWTRPGSGSSVELETTTGHKMVGSE